jgi:hypothetical protein
MNYRKLFSFFFLTNICITSLCAETLYLQCDVSGKWDDQRLEPARVLVTINDEKSSFVHIDVDGPDDYAVGSSSLSYEANGARHVGKNLSQEKMFWISSTVYRQNPSRVNEYNITINRISGQLNVNVIFSKGNMVSRLSYSGMCKKISSGNKF